MRIASLLIVAAIALAPGTARADEDTPVQDKVVLELQVEDWVTTESATVHVAIDAAFSATESAAVRIKVLDFLDRLVAEAAWHITGFRRTRDQTGLERWQVAAQARLPEDRLGRLHDRAKAISEPGTQVAIRHIDFTPTLAEREATATALRGRIYRLAREELERLRQAYPDRGFRIHGVDFVDRPFAPVARPDMPRQMIATTETRAPSAPSGEIAVSQKLLVRAVVVLAAAAPER